MVRSLAAVLCLVLVAVPGQAQEKPSSAPGDKPAVAWETDFDAAVARAQKEGKPLMVAFIMDGESANDETVQKIYTDPEFIKASRKLVCLAGSVGEHPMENGVCKRFAAGISCAVHNTIEKKARLRWLKSDTAIAPQHLFCNAQGNELFRKCYYHSKQQLIKAMALAVAGGAKEADTESKDVAKQESERVDKLLKDLDSKNQEVRDAAMRELAYADDPRALEAVAKKAKPTNDDSTRLSAIRALGKKGNYMAVRVLLPFLTEPGAPLLIQVAASLDTIQMPEAVPDLLGLLKREKRDRIRSTALRAAAKCGPDNLKVSELAMQMFKANPSAQIRAATIVALGTVKPDPKIAETLRPTLADKNQNMRALAAWALGNQSTPESIAALEKLARDDKAPEVRELATKAVRRCKGEKLEAYETAYRQFFYDYEN